MTIISVDHGNRFLKTKHKLLTSGIIESDTRPAFGSDILKYKDKYYTVSDKRISYERNKMLDSRFYILTLIAIAHELEFAGINPENKVIDVQILIGLPPAHFGLLAEKFEKHFVRGEVEAFEFHGKQYEIFINKAYAFPQAYAATMLIRQEIETYQKCVTISGFWGSSLPGTVVAGVGCGYMGCGAISLLKLRGAYVVAIDIRKESLDNAKKYGADETLSMKNSNCVKITV